MSGIKQFFKKFLGFEEENKDDSLQEEFALEEDIYRENKNFEQIGKVGKSEEITLYPQVFGDACEVVEQLEKGNVVTIDMNDVDIDTCKRITDFVLGAIYVLNGNVEKISRKVFRFWIIK